MCTTAGWGKQFRVVVKNNSDAHKYVQSAELNGKIYSNCYLLHTDIVNGGTLKITMGAAPDMAVGLQKTDRP